MASQTADAFVATKHHKVELDSLLVLPWCLKSA